MNGTTLHSPVQDVPIDRLNHRGRLLGAIGLFGATLFACAFLMFQVEPMIAKMLLPRFGGAPAVWTTCVVFFQMVLLAGYGYAHGVTTVVGERRALVVHAALVPLAMLVLPLRLPDVPVTPDRPTASLLYTLVRTVGFPFICLAASSSLLQRWFALTDHPRANDPYFLYGASNLGSLMGLLLYPLVVEPLLPLGEQGRVWTWGYAAFAVLTLACIALAWRTTRVAAPATATHAATTLSDKLRWLALSFIPSSLLLGVTSYVTTDIAAVPLLWVVPLSIYLATFIVAFGAWSRRPGSMAADLLPLLVTGGAVFMTPYAGLPVGTAVALHLGILGAAAMTCHGRLAQLRPSASRLTEFYLYVALGGTLGGLFNMLIAPRLFDSIAEYPLMIVAACAAAALGSREHTWRIGWLDAGWPLLVFTITLTTTLFVRWIGLDMVWSIPALGLPAVLAFSQTKRPVRFAFSIGGILWASSLTSTAYGNVVHAERTFFGVHRVSEDDRGQLRTLFSGTTVHGVQWRVPGRELEPTLYYARSAPIGQVIASLPALGQRAEVAVVGLGVGTLAAYARPEQQWTFYEVDAAVERLARETRYFTFLESCGSRCNVVLGDARLSLTNRQDARYDLLILDAFSSDAIPVHLLTRDAVALYLARLKPGGVLAFHTSNRHLELTPVVAQIAAHLGAVSLHQSLNLPDTGTTSAQSDSEWVVVARDPDDVAALVASGRWHTPRADPSTPLWTDDFSNILTALR